MTVATHCLPTGSLGTGELAIPSIDANTVAIEKAASGPYRGVIVFLHGFPFSYLDVPELFGASDVTTGFLQSYNRTLINNLKSDGWIVIQPPYREDRSSLLPALAILADVNNDVTRGNRYMAGMLHWWDHVVDFVHSYFGSDMPIVPFGGSWGGLHGFHIVKNRYTSLTSYIISQPATIPANVPLAILPWGFSDTHGMDIDQHYLDAVTIPGMVDYGTNDAVVGWGIAGEGTCPGGYTGPASNTDHIILNAQAAGMPVTRHETADAHASNSLTDVNEIYAYFTGTIDLLAPKNKTSLH